MPNKNDPSYDDKYLTKFLAMLIDHLTTRVAFKMPEREDRELCSTHARRAFDALRVHLEDYYRDVILGKPITPNNHEGYVPKFKIFKSDNTQVSPDARYLVLNLTKGPAEQLAALTYAKHTKVPLLSRDLVMLVDEITHGEPPKELPLSSWENVKHLTLGQLADLHDEYKRHVLKLERMVHSIMHSTGSPSFPGHVCVGHEPAREVNITIAGVGTRTIHLEALGLPYTLVRAREDEHPPRQLYAVGDNDDTLNFRTEDFQKAFNAYWDQSLPEYEPEYT